MEAGHGDPEIVGAFADHAGASVAAAMLRGCGISSVVTVLDGTRPVALAVRSEDAVAARELLGLDAATGTADAAERTGVLPRAHVPRRVVVAVGLGLLAFLATWAGVTAEMNRSHCDNFHGATLAVVVGPLAGLIALVLAVTAIGSRPGRGFAVTAIALALSPALVWVLAVSSSAGEHSWFICSS